MLSLAFSNRYEVLQEVLLARLAEERPGPFGVREIIVPSTALQRSVELAVADREGVAANLRFAYLAQWLWGQIGKVVPVGEVSPFTPALLAWRVFELLGEREWTGAHPRLARYLEQADELMRFELAGRVARLFDNYITYRPHWLEAWSESETTPGLETGARADEAWQAALWRRIAVSSGIRREHPASTFFAAVEGAGPVAATDLPPGVHVFCLPALPPLYRDILRRLARWVDVHMYVLNPCREYWFEIVEPRRLSWLIGQQRELYHETGNRLLASWGRQTQAHIDLLFEGEDGPDVDDSLFVPADGGTLLARIQNAVLDLRELAPGSVALAADDRSVEVHVCHSLTRELEVLHDRLLGLFAAPNPPGPEDVVVVTPDLERAAPLIDAVFGTAPLGRRIAYRITGLGQTRVNPVARVLDTALSLAASRMPASRMFELLQQAPVAQRFDLGEADLARVHDWLKAAGVRWGLDATHRERLGLPANGRHSLADGLHRLYLAHAWGDDDVSVFAGRVGAGNPEGSGAIALGHLWRYAETLGTLHEAGHARHDPDRWRDVLLEVLHGLVAENAEWADDLRSVRAAVHELHANMIAAGMRSELPLKVVHAALVALLDDPVRGGVPSGVVTFSTLSSLRNLPHRIVCAVGLDDGAFPGIERADEFDLMARHPARGDRQRRHDERNLFLDLVLSARECLHLSCAGRSIRDNSEKPPSVLIDELLDVAARACASDPRDPAALEAARARLCVQHPLQAFSVTYFAAEAGKDARLSSHNAEYCEALRMRLRRAVEKPAPRRGGLADDEATDEEDDTAADPGAPFFAEPLPPPGEEWRECSVDRLVRFLRNPSRYLLAERLGVRLPEGDEELLDDEPFLPDFPGRRHLADRLLPALLEGVDGAALRSLAVAGGEYPGGVLGEGLLERELAALRDYADELRGALAGEVIDAHATQLVFDVEGERWTLHAGFGDLRPRGLVRHRYDDMRAGDYLSAWIAHLALCASAPPGVVLCTEWHARDGVRRFRPCDSAHARLAELVELYREGLRAPLPFFAKAAWAWASNGQRRYFAEQKWHGGNRPGAGERNDPAIRLAFRGLPDPLDETFFGLAEQVVAPLLEHLDEPEP